jgi:hypothetical protein
VFFWDRVRILGLRDCVGDGVAWWAATWVLSSRQLKCPDGALKIDGVGDLDHWSLLLYEERRYCNSARHGDLGSVVQSILPKDRFG